MSARLLLIAIAAIGLTSSVTAQQALRLSIDEAQRYAEQHNYELQNATLEIKNAEIKRWQAISTMLPQVSAGFDYQNMCGYEMKFGGMGVIPMNPNGTFNMQAAIALTGAQIVSKNLNDIAIKMANIQQKQSRQALLSIQRCHHPTFSVDISINKIQRDWFHGNSAIQRIKESSSYAVHFLIQSSLCIIPLYDRNNNFLNLSCFLSIC